MANVWEGACCDLEDSDEEDVAVATATIIILAGARRKKRSCWVRDWISRRETHGAYASLIQELAAEDPQAYKSFVRMKLEHFTELLGLVDPLIRKQDTIMRKAITPGERLAVTLRYLGSGSSFTDLMFLFRIPDNTIHQIVMETCDALYSVLNDDYLKVPSTPQEWAQIAQEFYGRWNLPNCVGALDGKHVEIKSPGEGSTFHNYQGYFSIILLALVDARYRFLFVDVGTNGRAGDAAVFRDSKLAEGLNKNTLQLPAQIPLPGRQKPVPFYIVGDDAFPLKPWLMKPFPFKKIRDSVTNAEAEEERRRQRIFDYRLSRARRISENAFGILSARFGVFRGFMHLSPEKATRVTLAALTLHNFLMTRNDSVFAPPSLIDREQAASHELIPGDWRRNELGLDGLHMQHTNQSSKYAREVRDEIKLYVNNEGQVPWQERLVFGGAARM